MFQIKGYIMKNFKSSKRNPPMKKMLVILFSAAAFLLQAEVKICAHCGKGARYMRYSAENMHFCSEKCAKAKFSCAGCSELLRGRYMIATGLNGESRRYCSRCSQHKKCFSCQFPTPTGKFYRDGRVQCLNCSRQALNPQQAAELLQQLRHELAEMHKFDPLHKITLRLVDHSTLKKIANSPNVMGCMKVLVTTKETGRVRRKKINKEWQCTLYLLNDLPPAAAAKVIIHELTHDYLYHHAGAGKDPVITEGICEAVSGQWLLRRKYKGYFEAMKKNPDPVYGTGFRKLYPQLERYGLEGLTERYRSMFTPF